MVNDRTAAPPSVASSQTSASEDVRGRLQEGVRRHSQGFFIVALLVVTVAAIILLLLRSEGAATSNAVGFDGGIQMQFGLSREPINRSLRIDLCDPNSGINLTFPECRTQDETQEAPETRPDVVSATLASDPLRIDEKHGDGGNDGQFPAAQVAISASNVASTAIIVTVNANPASPDEVRAGTYRGKIIVDRTSGPAVQIPVDISLQSRSGQIVAKVLVALSVGALLGTLIKWMNEAFTPLAALRRRQRAIDSLLSGHMDALPEGVVIRLNRIREEIKRLQQEGVGEDLDLISRNQEALLAFVGAVEGLERQVARQKLVFESMKLDPSAQQLMQIESDFISSLRRTVWPWKVDPKDLEAKLQKAVGQFNKVTSVMLFKSEPELRRTLRYVVEKPDEALTEDVSLPPEAHDDTATQAAPELSPARVAHALRLDVQGSETSVNGRDEPRRPVSLWLLDNAWWLTLLVIAALVVFAGFQLQFIDSPAFAGTAGDYVGLIAWALAIQVAGGTILETIGKLRTTANSP